MFQVKAMVIKFFTARTVHTTLQRLVRGANRGANPGAAYQLEALDSSEEVANDFADAESDFMNVHKSHQQHEHEMQKQRQQNRLWVVKQKYFKEKLPNFLTYAEKEQIKLLHTRDPEEWNAEKLADSFPVSPELVNKILRADWRPRSVKRIRHHDEAVIKNWDTLNSGGFQELQPALREHLRKFAKRTSYDLMQKPMINWEQRPKLPKPCGDEFSSIITSCKNSEKHQNVSLYTEKICPSAVSRANDSEDTYMLEKVRDRRLMRIQELKSMKLSGSDQTTSCDLIANEKCAAKAFQNPNGTGILPKEFEKFQSKEIVIGQEDRRRFEMTTVKDRIYIPKKLRSKGATYKVEDCYYDDDGEFLYRVPGMSG